MTRKKSQTNSPDGAKQALRNAKNAIQPPDGITLRQVDAPFWNSITSAKPADMWSDSDLAQAATLARSMADIERLQVEINSEGDLVDGRINRKHVLVETLTRRVIALSRVLQIHSRARNGETRDLDPAKRAAAAAKAGLRLVASDGLIPGLHDE